MAPPSKDPFSDIEPWEAEPEALDIFDTSLYQPHERLSKETSERRYFEKLRTLRAYSNCWEFRGLPILQGYCGHVNFLVDINVVDDLPINESLFDNSVLARETYRVFDLIKLQDLHQGHTDDPLDFTPYTWPTYLGPINCQWLNQGNCDWLYFESQPLIDDLETITWNTAISDKHYVSCQFVLIRSARNAGNPYRIEQRIPRDNFLAWMHQIMDSLTLELNSEGRVRKELVQAQPSASDKPLLVCTPEQVKEAKHVLYMWSARGYQAEGKSHEDDHRANPEDIAAFIDERIKPRPLPNSYPPGEPLQLSAHSPSAEPQVSQAAAK